MSLKTGAILEFGEYVIDPASRSVLRAGEPLAMPRRAFDLLYLLASHPGEPLSREHLLRTVWPESHVDENSLSQGISALRRALDEKPGESSCIATLPGRGYQFLPAVRRIGGESEDEGREALSASEGVLLEEHLVRSSVITEERRTSSMRTLVLRIGIPAALVVAAGSAIGYRLWRDRPDATPGHVTAVIADLDNATGDPEFDHTLNKVLQIDLQQSPYFGVVSEGRARRTLKMMQQDPAEPLTATLAREVCERVNGQEYLTPAIAKLGSGYALTMQVNACSDGRTLGSGYQEVKTKEGVLSAWAELTRTIRRAAGESRHSVQEFNKPLYDEPTSSLDALRAYSEATRLGDAGHFAESIALYQHAVELDPNFAVAYADMSTMYYNIDDQTHSTAAMTKAYALRDTVNEREHFYIELRYAQSVTGDLHALLDALHRWAALYPQDNLPLSDLVNFETWTGHYAEAAEYADRVAAIEHAQNIHNGISQEIAARAYHHANLPDKLRATYAEAVQNKVDTEGLHSVMLEFASENGDKAEVARQIAWARNTPNEAHILQEAGSAALAAGQARKADALFVEARAAAARDKVQDSLPDLDDYFVRMLVEVGWKERAQQLLKSLPAVDPTLDRAFAQAALGETAPALAAAEHLRTASPQDTLVNVEYVPSVQAAVAIQQKRPLDAIELMQSAESFELRDPTVPYLRGQSLLAAGRPAEATKEFAKLADHPWIADPPSPLIVLAHVGLARAYAQRHDDLQARREYGTFFALWADADPDLPILREAQHEAAALSSK
jgi:DNA-binding winged helix-turn-helix (wHTH) protein/tetratricopeptide (TPR) repeat protein